jgi:hypothetical protein
MDQLSPEFCSLYALDNLCALCGTFVALDEATTVTDLGDLYIAHDWHEIP